MANKNIFLGLQVLVITYITMIHCEPPGRACYHAKVCVHNSAEKCGIDSKGNLRKFLDSCDLKEYNCLKGTDFTKTVFEKCASLPSPKDDSKKQNKNKNEESEEPDNQSQSSSETKTKDSSASNVQQNDNLKKKSSKPQSGNNIYNLKGVKNEEVSVNTNEEQESVPREDNVEQTNGVTAENDDLKGEVESEINIKENNASKPETVIQNDGPDSDDNDSSQNNDNENEEQDEEVTEDKKKD